MSKVSRSVYQKLAEENKRLMRDLRLMTMGSAYQRVTTYGKWKKHFQYEDDVNIALKEVANQYFKDHPELKLEAMIKERTSGESV